MRGKALAPGAVGLGVAALAAVPASAATFTVMNLNDAGAGSLRQAIVDSNTSAGADVIDFQPGLTGTITLTTGQLYIIDSVDVQGPGAAVISVSGNNASRVFYLYNGSATLDVTIQDLTITDGAADIGAGIVNFDENLTLDGVTITGNASTGDGGGVWADGFSMNLTIRNTTISGNTSGDEGGGMYVEDTGGLLLIENSIVTGNQSFGAGGGIYFYDPDNDVTIRGTTISGNTAGTIGGGVYLYSPDAGVFTIEETTISGNSAQHGGGAYLYSPDHSGQIRNSTISGNQATAGNGGGLVLYNFYDFSLDFVTVASNTATGNGGGIFVESGTTLPISNSIIGDNTAATDNDLANGAEPQFDLSYSLVESPGGASINDLGNNILNADPQLGALANNGGPTQTQRPALTSPVINVADPATLLATDERGEQREYPVLPDMGALELVGGVIQFNPTSANVAENGGSVTLTVVRDIGTDPASVDFTTNAGTATPGAGNDYTTNTGTLNFAAGDLSETFDVTILDDPNSEGSEQFTATLSNQSGDATLGADTINTVTITDDASGTAQFTVASVNALEEDGSVTLTVTRTGGTEGPLTVNFTTGDGSATSPADFASAAGNITFPDGDATPQTITITLVNDPDVEGSETFTVTLSGASVGSPSTVLVNLASADVAPIPTLSFFGKLFFGLLSAFTALYVMVRRGGSSAFLIGALLIAIAASTPAFAAKPSGRGAQKAAAQKEAKAEKHKGTLASLTRDGENITIQLKDGSSVTLPASKVRVIDARSGRRQGATLEQVAAGSNVVVRIRKDKSGNVKSAKIKLTK